MLVKDFLFKLINDLDMSYEDQCYLRGYVDCFYSDTDTTDVMFDKIATVMRYSDDSGD